VAWSISNRRLSVAAVVRGSRGLSFADGGSSHSSCVHLGVSNLPSPTGLALPLLVQIRSRPCSAYRSVATEAKLKARGFKSRIHVRAGRNRPLSPAQEAANRKKGKIRARIEHVFGAQETAPGGRIVRTIGMVRARAKIGLANLAYNIRRLVTLERMATA
jgi:DDE family transposase